ncbi:cytochrome o ubiquinol oxidase subunit 2 [Methylobacterium brachiatum]|uniref:Ubiquinol oxidase polypeptide II n=1 Tax=Methylobacterium brachiatum TaxID=269660 RepID=A0AAJ1U2H0_9HYPH|nr:ubiquinol oxidase subunit II [Methylobacterium brachiatum]MCB4805591.1 ubiquinol oxidase subunit II [Methylobacterium brachiatum]MDQ0546753.1 cytochrome o ubiquinol oxidase subunit 2 [Methylobacterium brachiatum]
MRRAAGLPLLALSLLLGGCDMVVMNPTGDVAYQQRNLILFSVGVMLLIIVPVMVLTVLFAYRYRRGNPNKIYDPSFDHSTTLELVIWSCPLLIIIALSAVTWTSTHLLDPFRPLERLAPGVPVPPDAKPLNVQVVALDWKWLFIYPDLGIATVNELALPVNVPVRFSITSTDQFNTFYAPTLAGMIYAMPTMRSELNAVLNKPGESWGYSGNYTGRGYSDMRFKLRGVEGANFDRWVADVKAVGSGLELSTLVELIKPSEKVPVMHFATVQDGLFDRAVNRCIEPGKPCMIDIMRQDMQASGGHPHHSHPAPAMPPGREAEPLTGAKPKPALQKAPDEKGTSPNVTKPVAPEPPGQTKPGDARNRDQSAIEPHPVTGARRAGQA